MTVHGVAGSSLSGADTSWAANAGAIRFGKIGEQRTAAILDRLAVGDGPTVLHDLKVPGNRANIDHVVVSGNVITLVDSKVWRRGFFWTFRGQTYRGRELFPHADKRTMRTAIKQLTKHLTPLKLDTGFKFVAPLIVVWPSTGVRSSSFVFMDTQGQTVVNGARFETRPQKFVGTEAANPAIVRALARLL